MLDGLTFGILGILLIAFVDYGQKGALHCSCSVGCAGRMS